MTISFYSTADPKNKLVKQLTYKDGTTVARNTTDVDILNPVLIMKYKSVYLTGVNYMYIEDFKRYYFCRVEVLTGGNVRIVGEVDPLMTAAEQIKSSGACLVLRSAGNVAPYLTDNNQALSTQKTVTVKKFPYEFKGFSIMLLAAGGE